MTDIIFREATLADLPVLKEFEQGVVQAERPFNPMIRDADVTYYDLAALIESTDACVIVAEADGTIVASGYVKIIASEPCFVHDRHAYLGFMYVAPAARRQGLNQRILTRLVEWASARGIPDCYLDVYAANTGAISAYEKFGFKPNVVEMRLDNTRRSDD
ncbi:MAG: GNAT family N-acetyltransferase [Pseudomonadota bacterium]